MESYASIFYYKYIKLLIAFRINMILPDNTYNYMIYCAFKYIYFTCVQFYLYVYK